MKRYLPVLVSIIFLLSFTASLLADGSVEQQLDQDTVQIQQDLQNTASSGQDNSYYAGNSAGKQDAVGNVIYGCGGFACGPFGVLAAVLIKTDPDPMLMNDLIQTRGAAYASGYASGYSKETRTKNVIYAGAGWVISMAVSLAYSAATTTDDDQYDRRTIPLFGLSLPLGTIRLAESPRH